MDCPTFTEIYNSAINCSEYGNSFCWNTDELPMTDYLHPGKTTIGQYYAKPTSKLVDVIKQKHWRKLSLGSLTFSRQCTTAQVIGCSASSRQLWICSTKPSCLQSRLGSQWLLFPNKKSEAPSSWNLVYRWWITEDRCRGMVWVSKQKFIFKAKTAQKTSWKSTLMLVENMNVSKNDSMCDITCSYLQPSSKTCWSPLVHVP